MESGGTVQDRGQVDRSQVRTTTSLTAPTSTDQYPRLVSVIRACLALETTRSSPLPEFLEQIQDLRSSAEPPGSISST